LGEFQRFVADIPLGQLYDTLPGFHHTPIYYDQFLHTLKSGHHDPAIDARKQESEAVELIKKIQQRESLVSLLMRPYHSSILHDRVVHNDPKINNILIDTRTHKGIGIIDLDTVKSGLIHFDYGDCLRSAANPAGEEARDIRHVSFDLKIFEQITRGYVEEAHFFLSKADIEYLVDSIKVIAFELGTRFFTDYLKGDVYFKISYPLQNLNRARVQFVLLQDIEMKEEKAREIMRTLIRKT
jgi:Ser/Thr protein kinase RdoA (MazF antagonist)